MAPQRPGVLNPHSDDEAVVLVAVPGITCENIQCRGEPPGRSQLDFLAGRLAARNILDEDLLQQPREVRVLRSHLLGGHEVV